MRMLVAMLAVFPLLCDMAWAQVTISDGVVRPVPWTHCSMRATDPSLPNISSPVFRKSYETEREVMRALLTIMQNAPVRNGYVLYSTPSCYSSDTKAEAERSMVGSRGGFFREVGADVMRRAEETAAAAKEEAEIQRLAAEETRRLGAHRAAEAEKLVRMRRAAERARNKGCPLGPNAPVMCM